MNNEKLDKYFYLGSPILFFSSIIIPVFVFFPVIFGLCAIISAPNIETLVILLGCILTSFIWIVFLKQKTNILYSWGKFTSNGVYIKQGLKSKFINFHNFKYVGIAYYKHSLLNSNFGTIQYFIVFSLSRVDISYQSNINLWNPPPHSFKIKFNKKLYNYLLKILPQKQKKQLEYDYISKILRFKN